MLIRKLLYLFIVLAASPAAATTFEVSSNDRVTLQASTVAEFDEPWVRVDIAGDSAKEAERFEWGERIREVEEGPNGALWVLEDGSDARLLKLTPKN